MYQDPQMLPKEEWYFQSDKDDWFPTLAPNTKGKVQPLISAFSQPKNRYENC